VSNVSNATARTAHENFASKVKEGISNFDAVVGHKHWNDFLNSSVPGAGITYQQALANAHHAKSLSDMKVIFSTFTEKYIPADNSGGYTGVAPSGGSGGPVAAPKKEMLKMSDRRKASEDYLKGRITQQQLEAIKQAFTQADKEGRVDYEN
jgi:hypothetical protein